MLWNVYNCVLEFAVYIVLCECKLQLFENS
jgi:hypothetical protein